MAVTYDSTTDTYSMTFAELNNWLSQQSANTVNTPYNLLITSYTKSNCYGMNSAPSGTFEYVFQHNLTKYVNIKLAAIEISAEISDVQYMFNGCTNIIEADISVLTNLFRVHNMFRGCTNLKTVIFHTELPKPIDGSYMFFNCEKLTSVNINAFTNFTAVSNMFEGCNSLEEIDLSSFTNVINASSLFKNCTSLKYVNIRPLTKVESYGHIFQGCTSLSCLSNFPYNEDENQKLYVGYIFNNVPSLYNIGIIRNQMDNSRLYGSNIKSVGVLVSSLSNLDLQDLNGTKFYTTSQYYSGLSSELATDYPNSNFEVIEVDACLDYDELEDWLEAQPQNTVETPYKIFIGGGLSADKVKGSLTWSQGYYGDLTVVPSDLSNIILTKGKYVNLSYSQLPSDCTDLTAAVSGSIENNINLIPQDYITNFCEIPSTVTTIIGFAYHSEGLKSFGEDNIIPSNVFDARWAFYFDENNISKLKIEHQIPRNSEYSGWILDSNTKIYAKDYTYFKNNYSTLHNNRQIILECDYSDLDTYLGWFRNSCDSVNLKVNGLSYADLRDWSATQGSSLSRKLLGENISDSTVQNYVNSSTFDLRLTEAPDNLGTLYYCFKNGNVKYSFDIPYTVQVMVGAYYGCKLVEAPVLSERTSDMSQAFLGTLITEAPIIPNSVTDISYAFQDTNISEMPDLPNHRLTNISGAFRNTNITRAKRIPPTVTNMYMCFYECSSLIEVENVPSSVTNLEHCFEKCSSLEAINGWEVDTRNATMTSCFSKCSSLTEINTTTKKTVDYDKWVHITVKTDTTDNTKYNLTLRTLATETQQAQTLTIQVDKAVIYSYLTDEILFSPNGTLSDSYITDMLNYKYPFGGGLDPANKNFVLWAAQGSAVKQNLSSQSGFTGSDINVSNNNNTKIASIIGKYTGEVIPTGTMFIYGGATAPSGWLLCDGSAVSRSTYAELFSIIGTYYGVGDGSTTFNIPDMRDRFAQGASTSNPIGTKLEAGIPNIKGSIGCASEGLFNGRGTITTTGALSVSGNNKYCGGDNGDSNRPSTFYIEARNGETKKDGVLKTANEAHVYGESDTVQPPAVCMNYIIKY